MSYRAPLADFAFLFRHVVPLEALAATERFAEATPETAEAILSEAAKMAEEKLAPLQRPGDEHPARLEGDRVVTPPGFAEGYRAIAEGGWVAMAAPVEYGGLGLPQTLLCAVNEMMNGACLSLALNPLMTQGQIEALEHHASDEIKALYLPKLISGEWNGTMNLTEPGAGSDLGRLRTKAEPREDGTFAVTGQKIFISWADNDFTSNTIHLVLARLPDAPEGTKGISLFLVPKFIPDESGNPGERNAVRVVSLEHKMGLHGSPTAVMEYDGATGWLIGEPNRGLRAMFTMMNNARLGVGFEGVGVAEAATQKALAYALERAQGRAPIPDPHGTIIDHADVRRMLATMRAHTFAARAIGLATAHAIDLARATGDADQAARAALLTPIAKAYGTWAGKTAADIGIQVHGGMGYIEETGAAQFLRDVRVTEIYEGTNGIQAIDLVGRKLADGGKAAMAMLADVARTAAMAEERLPDLAAQLAAAEAGMAAATRWMLERDDINDRFAGAMPYLMAFAHVLGGHFHLKAALAEENEGPRTRLARFFIRQVMPAHDAFLAAAREGAAPLYAFAPEDFSA